MLRPYKSGIKLILISGILAGTFMIGRYSAYGAQRIPMTFDQILIGIGMVKATLETVEKNEQQLINVARQWERAQYTGTQATQRFEAIMNGQQAQVEASVSAFLARNISFKKGEGMPTTEFSEEMLNMVEYFMTKYPSLFRRYGD